MAISFGRTVNVLFSQILLPVSGPIRFVVYQSFGIPESVWFHTYGYRNGKSATDPALILNDYDFLLSR